MRVNYIVVILHLLPACAVGWAPANVKLLTRWAALVSPTHARPEHPRPDKWRSSEENAPPSWVSLNGLWEADGSPTDLSAPPFGTTLPREILVPFPFEAALSGIRELPVHGYMWYRRNISRALQPHHARGRVLLNFEAVDWHAEVYLGGKHLGNHSGGYDGFSFDITEHMVGAADGAVELLVGVYDPTEGGDQPHGKQYRAAFDPKGVSSKYTSTSGIWATVWLEYVGPAYIADFEIVPTVGDGFADVVMTPTVVLSSSSKSGSSDRNGGSSSGGIGEDGCTVTFTMLDQGVPVGTASGPATGSVTVRLSMPKLWTPSSPFLYNATVVLACGAANAKEDGTGTPGTSRADAGETSVDSVHTYVGVRSVGLKALRSLPSAGYKYPVPSASSVLPGYPKPAASAADCEQQCNAPLCAAWNYGPATPSPPPPPPPPPSPPPPPPSPPGGPTVGVDLHGGDLVDGGVKLNATFSINGSSAVCKAMCEAYGGCRAWVIDIPNCVARGHSTFTDSLCFLKGKNTQRMQNKCRVSGTVGGGVTVGSGGIVEDAAHGNRAGRVSNGAGKVCTLQSTIPKGPILQDAAATCGYWSTKLMLNNEPAPFLAGILSQGFWPDGEYTAPDDLADIYELESEKEMGFNFIRKHIKVGPHRWYYHADRLGMMVWQDMPETIHGVGSSPNFLAELKAMVQGRKNHPCIVGWDIFNEAAPPIELVGTSVNTIKELDPHGRPVNALSGASSQRPWWNVTDVQDFHTDGPPTAALNATLLVGTSEAHRCGCLPPTGHVWFHDLKKPCYSVTQGVDCAEASASYMPWAQTESQAIRFFGLSATGYVQNRDMEGECNGLLAYDAFPKLNATPIVLGNKLLADVHASTWPSASAVTNDRLTDSLT